MIRDTRHPLRSRQPRLLSPLRDFLRLESSGAILLAAGTVAALVWANSPWSASYHSFWSTELSLRLDGHVLSLDLRHWLNDGLMTVFFLVVGLEIKRELTSGHLATRRTAMTPIIGAIGGMAVPALLYLAIAGGTEPRGWAVPMATDIALALGVVAAAGTVEPSLRAFLLGLAIVDDIGAIVVIAIFYSSGVELWWLTAALGALGAVIASRAAGLQQHGVYIVCGAVAWFCLHEAGVHPTLAGVALGLLAPSTPRIAPEFVDVDELVDLSTDEAARTTTALARGSVSVVEWLEHVLHPWTSYVIVPLFALANAGIELSTTGFATAVRSPVAWGVFVGLVAGKPLGIRLATGIASRTVIAAKPNAPERQLMGVGAAAGIGFTVAFFVTDLAFDDATDRADAKLSILVASVVAGAIALTSLHVGSRFTRRSHASNM